MPQGILKIISVVVLTAVSFSSLAEVTVTFPSGKTVTMYNAEDYNHLIPAICPFDTMEEALEYFFTPLDRKRCSTLEQYKEYHLCSISLSHTSLSPEEFLSMEETEWVEYTCRMEITICGHKECHF